MALELRSLTCRFGKNLALDGVSLRVHVGECYGFIGHNGAGKTTAMRIALGLVRPAKGEVFIDGWNVARNPREARARTGGLIEIPGFHGHLTGRENLLLLARLQGIARRDAAVEVEALLKRLGLADAMHKPVRTYSQGMRQRLGIAQALLGRPRYVLLDEPTNGLDPEGIAEMRELIRSYREEGVGFLVSSHQLRELSTLCNRVGVLKKGRLLLETSMEQLLKSGASSYRLKTDSDSRAAQALAPFSIRTEPHVGGGLRLEFASNGGEPVVTPGKAAAAVVNAGLDLSLFAPEETTLEDLYLRLSNESPAAGEFLFTDEKGTGGDRASAQEHSIVKIAPPSPVLRVFRYDIARVARKGRGFFVFLLPALIGVFAVIRRWAQWTQETQRVEAGEVFSSTAVTAFEGVAVGLKAGLPVAVFVLAMIASLTIAGEESKGTLRNVAMRSLGRWQIAFGKILSLMLSTAILYGGLLLTVWIASTLAFDFVGVSEILPNGEEFPLISVEELWPELRRAVFFPGLALLSFGAIGFGLGASTSSAAVALVLAIGGTALLDVGRVLARGFGVEAWMPTAYVPSLLGDTSAVEGLITLARGASNLSVQSTEMAVFVPFLWVFLGVFSGVLLVVRRSIP